MCSIFDVPASWTAASSTKVSLPQVRLGRVTEQIESSDDPMISVIALTTSEWHIARRVRVGVDEERVEMFKASSLKLNPTPVVGNGCTKLSSWEFLRENRDD